MKKTGLVLSMIALTVSLSIQGVLSSEFPSKEIRVIIPFSAGGQSDLTARKLAEIIQKKKFLSQPMIVVNMPGANTMNGLTTFKNSAKDGHTILLHHTDMIPQNLFKAIPIHYDDFDMVCQIMQFPFVITTQGDAKWDSASQFIADAKANSGAHMIAAPAPGGATYLAGIMFLKAAGIDQDVLVRPAEGGNDAATALMSKAVSIRVAGQSDSARFVKGGQEKALMVLSVEKSPVFPDAESIADINAPAKYAIQMSSGIWAPKGTPEEIKDALAEAFKKAVDSPEFQEFMTVQTATPAFLSRDEWHKVFKNYEKQYQALINEMQ